MAARMKKPAYGLNDAPRRWWNILDGKLQSYHLEPSRADRCTYVLYHNKQQSSREAAAQRKKEQSPMPLKWLNGSRNETLEQVLDYMMDPVSNNNGWSANWGWSKFE